MLKRLALLVVVLLVAAGGGAVWLRAGTKPVPPLEQANALFAAGNIQGAQAVARKLVTQDPRNAEAHLLLARIGIVLSDWASVEKEARALRGLRYDRLVVSPMLARALILQRQYQDVLTEIPGVAARTDEQAVNQALRSWAYLRLDDALQAQASLTAAVQLGPNEPVVLLQEARMAVQQGRTDQALSKVDTVLRREPGSIEALLIKSEVLTAGGDAAGAVAVLDTAVGLSPLSPQLRLARARRLLRMGENARAQADVDVVRSVSPRESEANYDSAVLLLRAGKFSDAATEFDRLGVDLDRFPDGYLYRAQAAVRLGNLQSALDSLDRLLKLRPRDVVALRLAGQLDLQTQQPSRALDVLQALVAETRDDAEAQDMLGRAYFMLGRTEEAVESFGRASALAPDDKSYAAHLVAARTQFGVAPLPDAAPEAIK